MEEQTSYLILSWILRMRAYWEDAGYLFSTKLWWLIIPKLKIRYKIHSWFIDFNLFNISDQEKIKEKIKSKNQIRTKSKWKVEYLALFTNSPVLEQNQAVKQVDVFFWDVP